jgi:hypothetical protein
MRLVRHANLRRELRARSFGCLGERRHRQPSSKGFLSPAKNHTRVDHNELYGTVCRTPPRHRSRQPSSPPHHARGRPRRDRYRILGNTLVRPRHLRMLQAALWLLDSARRLRQFRERRRKRMEQPRLSCQKTYSGGGLDSSANRAGTR